MSKRKYTIILFIVIYIAADILMDILLFPRLTETSQEHHKTVVERHIVFFGLVPVWVIGLMYFEKRKIKPAQVFFISALAATVLFAFTSLPLIWIAGCVSSLADVCLFLHDFGLPVYFSIAVPVFLYKIYKKPALHKS